MLLQYRLGNNWLVSGVKMDLATVLLLHKSSLAAGALCFAYVHWQSREPGLDVLAFGFGLLAFGSTLAGWGEQGILTSTTWQMGSFTAGILGHALMAIGLVQLSCRRRHRADWLVVAAAVGLILLVWRMGWHEDNATRAVLFNLASACFLAIALVSIVKGYLKDGLPSRFALMGALLASIFFALQTVLVFALPVLDVLEVSHAFFMLIICQFTIVLFTVVLVQERVVVMFKQLADTDALTGVPNRQHFLSSLPQKLRPGDAFIMLDIDHFKSINDRFGHEAGDLVLTGVAQAIAGATGPGTLLGRLGGEEFCLFLRGQTEETALAGAERIRLAVKSSAPGPVTASASLGVAVWSGTEDARTLRGKADQALYVAKQSGRDKVVLHTAETDPGL